MNRFMGQKAPAQLTAWIDNGRAAGADGAADLNYSLLQRSAALPAGNDRLVVLRKVPAVAT